VHTDLSRGFLINTAYSSSEYERADIQSVFGVHALGEDGFMGFTPDPDSLGELLTSLFFEKQ
jgi:hypothetical protein